ncbi:hypothetical protein R3P38DRAFT_2813931 [Favolaschia claudopus]|uniref:RBPJ-interacting and tubulin-associated protein 1 n=1 Tax=Favolaschia claudopus TaxID=2862362 RepID=A0AAV9Z422_9AGAR
MTDPKGTGAISRPAGQDPGQPTMMPARKIFNSDKTSQNWLSASPDSDKKPNFEPPGQVKNSDKTWGPPTKPGWDPDKSRQTLINRKRWLSAAESRPNQRVLSKSGPFSRLICSRLASKMFLCRTKPVRQPENHIQAVKRPKMNPRRKFSIFPDFSSFWRFSGGLVENSDKTPAWLRPGSNSDKNTPIWGPDKNAQNPEFRGQAS